MPPLRRLRALAVCLALASVWSLSGPALAADVGTAPQIGSFGSFPPNPPGLLGTLTIQNAVHDATGAVYVVESFRISKFDRDGNYLLSWNCATCYGIDVNQATGDVYVTLQNANVVQQFTSTGAFVRQWGSFGFANGQFRGPHGIAVDPGTGNVYVFDTGNGRVQVFDGQGNYLRQFGGITVFSGSISPGGVAFDAVNHWVYVTDPPAYRVSKFAEDGTRLTYWGDPVGTTPGHFRWPRSVEVDGSGLVYVTDTDSERIQFFTPDGVYLGQFHGPQDLVNGPFHPRDIAINRLTGEKYVNASYAWREDKFDASNAYVKSFGGKNKDGSLLDAPTALDVTPNGDVVVVDVNDFMMKRFSAGGGFRRQWSASNRVDVTMPGLIGQGAHSAIAVDPDGEVWGGIVAVFYASDPPTPWIWRYSPLGVVTEFLARKPSSGTYEEQIRDVAIEPATRDIFVSDDAYAKLKRIDRAGNTLIDFTAQSPAGLAFRNGQLYMVDYGANQIRRFNGQLVEQLPAFGCPGSGDGQFWFGPMTSLDVRADGEIFVADTNNHRIQELSPTGAFVAKRGTLGNTTGQFRQPQGVALSPNGDVLYVVDQLNFRVQMFCLTTTAACSALLDADGDGRADPNDNCIDAPNPSQSNADGDALGDACDPCPNDPMNDVDGDGVCGDVDNCPVVANPDQADSDGNGVGDACDVCPVGQSDPDGDLICGADNCPYAANAGQEDHGALLTTTADGIGDACQCGDAAAPGGVIDGDDLTAYRQQLTQDPALSTPSPRCRVIDNHTGCSIVDAAVLQRALAALPPGIAQVCAAATAP